MCSSRYREWQKEVDFADGGRSVDAILCPPAKFSEGRRGDASVKRVASDCVWMGVAILRRG